MIFLLKKYKLCYKIVKEMKLLVNKIKVYTAFLKIEKLLNDDFFEY